MSGPIRVVVADDEPLVREGWGAVLAAEPDVAVVGHAADGAAAVAAVVGQDADVVLMDLRMPGTDGLEATRTIGRLRPAVRTIVVTTFESDANVWAAMLAGAAGFVLKRSPAAELVAAIRTVHGSDALLFPSALRRVAARHAPPRAAGPRASLTGREEQVLRLLARGLSNPEMAGRLGVGAETVKTHVGNVLAKLGARDRTQAVVMAYELGFVVPGAPE